MNRLFLFVFLTALPLAAAGAESLGRVRATGRLNSTYLRQLSSGIQSVPIQAEAPKPRLVEFARQVRPVLEENCVQCHGPKKQKGRFRVDTLDPNLLHGADISWWLEVFDVLSNGEMPPQDDVHLVDEDRQAVIDWLSAEIQVASEVRRHEQGHSSFRRMTRYEYNHALQDLLGLPFDFARDLPPETASGDGFKNSSEMLQMSAMQLGQYRELARTALQKATVKGDKPKESYFAINFAEMAKAEDAKMRNSKRDRSRGGKPVVVRSGSPHFLDRESGDAISNPRYNLRGRPHPSTDASARTPPVSSFGLAIPGKGRTVVNLGSGLPDRGNLRIRIRAARLSREGSPPRLRLYYAFQASNNSHASVEVSKRDRSIEDAQFYEWTVALSEINRNPFRGQRIAKINSTESIVIENTNPDSDAAAFIDCLDVQTPAYDQWPPKSHTRIFPVRAATDEITYARDVLASFMRRAWRRDISGEEIERKLARYREIRTGFETTQDTLLEVLVGVLASPNFLYLARSAESAQFELATRLSMFLWSSIPDEELLSLARTGKLNRSGELRSQVARMLSDPKAHRFSRHFVRQWLGLDLLDYLKVDEKVYRNFSDELKKAMQQEPIALFEEILGNNASIMDFLHADYVLVNEALAKHYRIPVPVPGVGFQRIALSGNRRGGLLTQAGLLAMNSDGKDSHPLKRGIWLLERILNDPPPPPPPSVPEIDVADPRIAKMTLKERMEDHRNDPACHSCHAKIDPWGIAFENYDAVGGWREEIGRQPVDASATLFNREELNGIEGLKSYLLRERQDQFVRSLVHKLTAYALGRPLGFADRASIDQITTRVRREGDGLATLVTSIVTSDLFQSE